MKHTHELRTHRRAHRLHQEELAHLVGASPSMIARLEKGFNAQLADLEIMLGLEVVFGKPLSHIFATLTAAVEEAVLRRAGALENVWRSIGDGRAKASLALIEEIKARVTVIPDVA